MEKQVYFFIGVFITLIFGGLVAVGAWSVTTDVILDKAALFFSALIVLLIFFVPILLFKNQILKSLLGRSESTLDDVASEFAALVNAVKNEDSLKFEESVSNLSRTGLSWYAWSNFYRWVITASISILIAFAGFSGTVLFYEQNKKLDRQNELLNLEQDSAILSLLSNVRELLKREIEQRDQVGFTGEFGVLEEGGDADDFECSIEALGWTDGYYEPLPVVLKLLEKQSENELLSENIKLTLESLLQDSDSSVVLGALIALDRIDAMPKGTRVSLENVHINSLSLTSTIEIRFISSSLNEFNCPNCTIELLYSSLSNFSDQKVKVDRALYSYIRGPGLEEIPEIQESLWDKSWYSNEYKIGKWTSSFIDVQRSWVIEDKKIEMESKENRVTCAMLSRFCRENKMYSCDDVPNAKERR